MSLGAVLLSPLVWLLPVHAAWKPVFAVLSIVALVAILVWITDRFDDAIAYLQEYVQGVHRSQLVSGDWRSARPQIGTALHSTGLDIFLNEFRASAAQLKQEVLFSGPERLYAPPRDRADPRQATCFIVMPFGEEWSPDVHRILARRAKPRACARCAGMTCSPPPISSRTSGKASMRPTSSSPISPGAIRMCSMNWGSPIPWRSRC